MIKPIFASLTIVALAMISAEAKTVKIPDADDAVASITFPGDWDVEEIDGGAEADSPDDHVYISAVAVEDETDMNAQIDDVFKMLAEHKVELDESTKKEEKFKINGMDATELHFEGKDEDGPTGVSIVFVPVKNNLVILTYWITLAQVEKHEPAVGKILNSLKPAK